MNNIIADAAPDSRRRWVKLDHTALSVSTVARFAPALALLVLAVVGFIASPVFLQSSNIRAILLSSTILMILAVGQTFVISTAGIDLSVSSVAQLGGIVLGVLVTTGHSLAVALIAALAVGATAGAINGLLVAKGRITDFIVTLGSFSVLAGVTLLVSDAKPKIVTSPFLIEVSTGGIGVISWMIVIALVVAVAARVLLFNTALGTHILAVGGNRGAADALGLSFTTVKVSVYAISGFLAALGGILLTARLGAAEPTAGAAYQLTSIAAAVLGGVSLFGGRSSIVGPLVGAIVLTGVVNLLTITGVPVYYQPVAVGIVVVLAALLRSLERP